MVKTVIKMTFPKVGEYLLTLSYLLFCRFVVCCLIVKENNNKKEFLVNFEVTFLVPFQYIIQVKQPCVRFNVHHEKVQVHVD